MKNFISYLAARLQERSTWLGLIGLLGTLGVTLSPTHSEAIATLGVALASAVLTLTVDKSGVQ